MSFTKNSNLIEDYYTSIAKYLLDKNIDKLNNVLIKLIQKNQLYAIHTWYKFNQVGDNNLIDDITRSLTYSVKDAYVLADYYSTQIETINSQEILANKLNEINLYLKASDKNTHKYQQNLRNKKIIQEQIEQLPHISLWYKAKTLLSSKSRAQKSYLDMLIELDIIKSLIKNIPFKFHKEVLLDEYNSKLSEYYNEVTQRYISQESNKNTNYTKNIELNYVYAKIIIDNKKYHTQLEKAQEIINAISSREYSDSINN